MKIHNYGNKHIIYVLLVDTSSSMAIDELNEALHLFGEALQEDKIYDCADICVVKFDSTVEVIVPFTSAAEYQPPVLTVSDSSDTAMNEAILIGLEEIEQIRAVYRTVGVDFWRPRMLLLTDSVATDTELSAYVHSRLQKTLEKKKIDFFPMRIGEGYNIAELKTYTKDGSGRVLKATKENFKETFITRPCGIPILGDSNSKWYTIELPDPIPDPIIIEL